MKLNTLIKIALSPKRIVELTTNGITHRLKDIPHPYHIPLTKENHKKFIDLVYSLNNVNDMIKKRPKKWAKEVWYISSKKNNSKLFKKMKAIGKAAKNNLLDY